MLRLFFRSACLAVFTSAAFCPWALFSVLAHAVPAKSSKVAKPEARSSETRAAGSYDAAFRTGQLAVQSFLAEFPKGADLHFHLQAGVYAETLIHVAGEDKLCIDPTESKFARNEKAEMVKEPCPAPLVAASELSGNLTQAQQDLYDHLINAFSMRNFVPTTGYSGHDQFFSTFDRFGGIDKRHTGDWIDDVTRRAASQNQQYLELLETPSFGHAARTAHELGWNPDLAQMRQALLDHGLRDEVATDREDIHTAIELRNRLQHCGTPEALPACQVQVRFVYQVLRAFSPQQVFAQTLLGFETVEQSIEQHSDDWVGINFVQPEDYMVAMRDYTLHMKMIEYLHTLYPKVHISLHAGELAPGHGAAGRDAVSHPPGAGAGSCGTHRTWRGRDVRRRRSCPAERACAGKHVMIEINLTSNDGILGIKGPEHPFQTYRAAHVPVALSTDDQGVSRIDITHEYVRAALEYHLSYQDLKQLARTGMEHNFLSGESLWAAPDVFTTVADGCKGQLPGAEKPSKSCKAFLDSNEKAAAQWELERRFREFEAKF